MSKSNITYNKIVEVFDWGAAVPRVVLNLGETVSAEPLESDAFLVKVQRFDSRLSAPLFDQGKRKVVAAYISNERGEKAVSGRHLTLELETHPARTLGSEIHWSFGRSVWVDTKYTIIQTRDITLKGKKLTDLNVTQLSETSCPQLDAFIYGAEVYLDPNEGEIALNYAAFVPDQAGAGKKPLIIWLHGAGEGGADATIPLAAHKACAFAEKSIQAYFGGAYVLVPQTLGQWLDRGYNEAEVGQTSRYTGALMNLIDRFLTKHQEIDTRRIYLGGASMGGFMALRLLLDYPDYFAAGFPICPALPAAYLSKEKARALKQRNLWFAVAAADDVVPGPEFTLGLYDRLIKAGAKNTHLYYPARILDKSGKYCCGNKPYEYSGHSAWIPVFNNDVYSIIGDRPISLMEWLAGQKILDQKV